METDSVRAVWVYVKSNIYNHVHSFRQKLRLFNP